MKKNKIILSFRKLNNPICILLIAGLVLRIILYFAFSPFNHPDEVLQFDAEGYHKLAVQLLNTGSLQIPDSDLDTFRTPGYPFFMYLIYSLFGVKPHVVMIAQMFISLASVYVIYLIGKNLFNEKAGIISSVLLSLEFDHLYYEYSILGDTLFVLILLLSFLSLIRFIRQDKILFLILTSILTGIASLIRPVTIFYPAVVIFIIIVSAYKNSKFSFLKIIKYSVLVLVFFSITISPWIIRNYSLYGYPKLTSFTGYNLLNYNVAFTMKRSENRSIDVIRQDLDSLVLKKGNPQKLDNPFYKSQIQTNIAADYIKNHKSEYFKANLKGMVNLYISMDFKPHLHRFFKAKDYTESKRGNFDNLAISFDRLKTIPVLYVFVGIFYAVVLMFYYSTAIWGVILLVNEKRYHILLYVCVIILYFTVLTGIVGMTRYKLPVSPFYILLSGYCLCTISMKKKSEKQAISFLPPLSV
jgi:4-amino-4-deoxy-L-arabinose transferase-like glycosyltransferase